MPAISSTTSLLAELEGTSHKKGWRRYVPGAKSACFTRFEKGEISGANGASSESTEKPKFQVGRALAVG
jgi:hypothetical protein